MKLMKLIGLSGTNGSGKDSVGTILSQKHRYLFISGSDMLRDEATRRGLPVEREVLRTISAEWRRESGLGVLVDKAIEQYKQQGGDEHFAGLVIASIRNPGEADRIHELGGTMVWVDADPQIRYDRIYSRQRTAEDNKTFEQFLAEEQAEMSHSGDEATLNMSGVKQKADIVLINEGNSMEVFEEQVKNEVAEKL